MRTISDDLERGDNPSPWPRNKRTVEEWAVQIKTKWQNNVESIFGVARDLETARAELGERSKEWVQLYRDELKFSKQIVSKLIAIAEDDHGNLSEVSYTILPASWYTLYALAKLKPDEFKVGIESGIIHAGMEQKDVGQLKPKKPKAPEVEAGKRPSVKQRPEVVEETVLSLIEDTTRDMDPTARVDFLRRMRVLVEHMEMAATANAQQEAA